MEAMVHDDERMDMDDAQWCLMVKKHRITYFMERPFKLAT